MAPKTRLIVAYFCLSVSSLWSQNQSFAPISARWYYRPFVQVPDSRLYTFTVTKDTLLGGRLGRELLCAQWENGQFQDYPNLNKYVYTTSDSVLYWVNNQWMLLFDFGAVPGDVIQSKVTYFDIPSGCSGPNPNELWDIAYRIDSIATEVIDSVLLRVQYVTSLCQDNDNCWAMGGLGVPEKIVERIGAIEAGYWWGQGAACLLGGLPAYLRCYEDRLINYSNPLAGTPCDFVSAADEIEYFNVKIYPNPAPEHTIISFSPLQLDINYKLLDHLGRTLQVGLLKSGDTSLDINIASESAGIYYLEFALKNQTKAYKIVKI
jgi:hypothetical protein